MRIKSIFEECTHGKKEVDFYTPIKIEFDANDDRLKKLFYYRWLNTESSFIEMAINSSTKKIVYITVVSINDTAVIHNINSFTYLKQTTEGNPLIDMGIFEENHIVTCNVNFSIALDNRKVYAIQHGAEVQSIIVMDDNVKLLLNDSACIVGFVFTNFTTSEWKVITEIMENNG